MKRILVNLEIINPEHQLPKDQFSLSVDLEDLATSSKDRSQVWQADLKTAVATAEHVNRRLNLPPECKHKDVQAAHFKPEPTKRCVYEAGCRWHKAKRTKQVMKWKRYNFPEIKRLH